ncbi:MAG: anthranilate phosphoribosyltransferase [Campylobacteraceae bacterium 4484_166]|nr:MAG: anthranilate phosphoribosyltransferase [Campylobacteraceae bacterium 4484_166]
MNNKLFNETLDDFENIFTNSWSSDKTKNYLIKLYQDGESFEQIAAASSVMQKYSTKLPIEESLKDTIIDNCGTGGDKSGTFNISTTCSLLLSACGSIVAKHGNKSITSQSGSADMLEALGLNLSLDIKTQVDMLEKCGFVFMFAINHHKAMKHIMPIRRSLNHRTIFNLLGPLTSPAGVKKQLVGVFDKAFTNKMANALKLNGASRAMVVSSKDGLDEISICDITYVSKLENGSIVDMVIDPRDFGFKLSTLDKLKGGDAITNSHITKDILEGKITDAKLDVVLLNTAYCLWVDGKIDDIKDGIKYLRDIIKTKTAIKKLKQIIDVSNSY